MKLFRSLIVILSIFVFTCFAGVSERISCAKQTDFSELDVYYCKTFFGFYPHRYYLLDRDNYRNMFIEFADQSMIRFTTIDYSRMKSIIELYTIQQSADKDNIYFVDSLVSTNRGSYVSMLMKEPKEIFWDYNYHKFVLGKGDTLNFIDFGESLIAKSLTFKRDDVSGEFGIWAKQGHKMKPLLPRAELKKIIDFINKGGDGIYNYDFHHIEFFLNFCDEKYLK